ncbi:hypothetical protein B4110_0334 [Parageobacillus toebii]|uniref:Uncharacterized protein n=1 Tax=Parageobacillus toebii TaxID=153151 RepID=A0A150N6Y5_9BACL|nr:hypothetical protein B4110_0334 [Parageobacillus toebii]
MTATAIVCFYLTYEELKLGISNTLQAFAPCFYLTYEELKIE